MTLQLIHRATASGLLADHPINLHEVRDVVRLRHILTYLSAETHKEFYRNEFLASLVIQLCVAIGNREQYSEMQDKTFEILEHLRDLVQPPTSPSVSDTRAANTEPVRHIKQSQQSDPSPPQFKPQQSSQASTQSNPRASTQSPQPVLTAEERSEQRKIERAAAEAARLMQMWIDRFGDPDEMMQRLRDAGVVIDDGIKLDASPQPLDKPLYRYNTSDLSGRVDPSVERLINMYADAFPVDDKGRPYLGTLGDALSKRVEEKQRQSKEEQLEEWRRQAEVRKRR